MLIGASRKLQMNRREFLRTGSAGVVCAAGLAGSRAAWAEGLGVPLGIQLYSVRDLLPKDYDGTLKQVAALGYKEVEAAGWYGHSAAEVKAAMQTAGLRCVSAHYSMDALRPKVEETIAFHKEMGAEYIVCSSPAHKVAPAAGARGGEFTLEDWQWNAGEFNRIGQAVKSAGMRFGYHNHFREFMKTDGAVPYDELLRLTDPALVTFEMDCGWVKVGGSDPIAYLQGPHKDRISMLHVKDFKPMPEGSGPEAKRTPAELGQGTMDMRAVLRAADPARIKHVFVEQEGFDMPPYESLKVDAEYMRGSRVG